MSPRSTRHQAVLSFESSKLLFLVNADPSSPLQGRLFTPSQSFPSSALHFTSISACFVPHQQQQECSNSWRYMRVGFWVDALASLVYTTNVRLPSTWSPRMYLVALNVSISNEGMVLSSPREVKYHHDIDGASSSSSALASSTTAILIERILNEVHWLFNGHIETTIGKLNERNTYAYIQGGAS